MTLPRLFAIFLLITFIRLSFRHLILLIKLRLRLRVLLSSLIRLIGALKFSLICVISTVSLILMMINPPDMKHFLVYKKDLLNGTVTTFHFSSFDDVKVFLKERMALIRLYGCFYDYRVLMII